MTVIHKLIPLGAGFSMRAAEPGGDTRSALAQAEMRYLPSQGLERRPTRQRSEHT